MASAPDDKSDLIYIHDAGASSPLAFDPDPDDDPGVNDIHHIGASSPLPPNPYDVPSVNSRHCHQAGVSSPLAFYPMNHPDPGYGYISRDYIDDDYSHYVGASSSLASASVGAPTLIRAVDGAPMENYTAPLPEVFTSVTGRASEVLEGESLRVPPRTPQVQTPKARLRVQPSRQKASPPVTVRPLGADAVAHALRLFSPSDTSETSMDVILESGTTPESRAQGIKARKYYEKAAGDAKALARGVRAKHLAPKATHSSSSPLNRLACECEGLFDEIQNILTPRKLEDGVVELCTDYQQHFAIWAAHLGVFAREGQCLDTRLRGNPDLEDLVVRLLSVLRHGLQQCKTQAFNQGGLPDKGGQPEPDVSRSRTNLVEKADWKIVDDTLTRLDSLGVTIRRSSNGKNVTGGKTFAANHDLEPFTDICARAIQSLYPSAHWSLKDHLSRSMADRYARIQVLESRHQKLKAHRELRAELPIPEPPNDEMQMQTASTITRKEPGDTFWGGASQLIPPSESDLSSVNLQQIGLNPSDGPLARYLRQSDEASTIQLRPVTYPPLPTPDENGFLTCKWCPEPLRKTLSVSEWRQHIDSDLMPYVCLSDECSEAHPAYPTFDEWLGHMGSHGRRWRQQVYLTSSWECPLCESNLDAYPCQHALYSHLEEAHGHDFTSEQLRVISRQSATEQQRAWNDCLLCCCAVDTYEALIPKRWRRRLQRESAKAAKTSTESPGPDLSYFDLLGFSSDSSSDSDDNMSFYRQSWFQSEARSKAMGRHIAGHLQMLMVLTMRLAALHSDDEGWDDDIRSVSVTIDEGDEDSRDMGDLGSSMSGDSDGA